MTRQPIPSFTSAIGGLPAAATDKSHARRMAERSRRFGEAMRLMEEGCWQTSFMLFAELADQGHPQAARIALLFARRGSSLFGGTFAASARRREGWERASD